MEAITTSPDGHFLMQSDGSPFFWLADTAWEIFHRLDREEVDCYLKDRADRGFTVVQAVATGKLDHRANRIPNRFGEAPFVKGDPRKPNSAYFAHVEWVVERAAHFGLRVALLPFWSAHHLVPSGGEQLFDISSARDYARWLSGLLSRYGVLWVLGGDMMPVCIGANISEHSPNGVSQSALVDFRPIFDAMAEEIRASHPGRVFLTYHPTSGNQLGAAAPRTSLYFGDRSWLSMNMLQTGHYEAGGGEEGGGSRATDLGALWQQFDFVWNPNYNYLPITAEYQSFPPRPVVDAEPSYEAHPILDTEVEARGYWEARDVRGSMYRALFAGAAGHSYGHFSIWDSYDPTRVSPSGIYDEAFSGYDRLSWREALGAPAADQLRHAKALMLSRPYFSRVPDQGVIASSPGEGRDHIRASRDRAGRYLMVYLPTKKPVDLDLTKLAGSTARAWYFDPCTGDAGLLAEEIPTSGVRKFRAPTHGSEPDWVLVVDDATEDFAAPGKVAV